MEPKYTFTIQNNFVYIHLSGCWNLRIACRYKDFIQDKMQNTIKTSPLGVLIDMRHWEVPTPEIEALIKDTVFEIFVRKEYSAIAWLASSDDFYSHLKKSFIPDLIPVPHSLEYFTDEAKATRWLAEKKFMKV